MSGSTKNYDFHGLHLGLKRQDGLSLLMLLLAIPVLVFLAALIVKGLPTFNEFNAIKRAVVRAQKEGSDPAMIRASFVRASLVDDISSLNPDDLKIERLADGSYRVAFAYEKRILLVEPISILIEYQGKAP